jgi:hypothetical protein
MYHLKFLICHLEKRPLDGLGVFETHIWPLLEATTLPKAKT